MQPMRPVHGGTPVPPRNPLKWRTLAFLLAWLLLTLTLMAINGAGWPLILGVGVLAVVACAASTWPGLRRWRRWRDGACPPRCANTPQPDRRSGCVRTSQPIRRVLSLPGGSPPRRWRSSISTCCCQHARATRCVDPDAPGRRTAAAAAAYPGARAGHPRTLPVWPCSGWGLPSHPRHRGCWWSLTPPFHPYRTLARPAVCFLWHCPAGHPGWALPTTLPCGARTFLGTGEPVTRPPG